MEAGSGQDRLQTLSIELRADHESIAQELVRMRQELGSRIEGVRRDFEVALLEHVERLERALVNQASLFEKRMERLEALFAETVGADVAADLLARLAD